jgi:hypothetical protein
MMLQDNGVYLGLAALFRVLHTAVSLQLFTSLLPREPVIAKIGNDGHNVLD